MVLGELLLVVHVELGLAQRDVLHLTLRYGALYFDLFVDLGYLLQSELLLDLLDVRGLVVSH